MSWSNDALKYQSNADNEIISFPFLLLAFLDVRTLKREEGQIQSLEEASLANLLRRQTANSWVVEEPDCKQGNEKGAKPKQVFMLARWVC